MTCKKTGLTFEREAIMERLYRGKTKCPVTGQSIHTSDFSLNSSLEAKITQWKADNEKPKMETSDDFDEEEYFQEILSMQKSLTSLKPVGNDSCDKTLYMPSSRNCRRLLSIRERVLNQRKETLLNTRIPDKRDMPKSLPKRLLTTSPSASAYAESSR